MANYPVGKVQQMVLNALVLTASDFGEAERIFEQHGLIVTSKRQGRTSIPEIHLAARTGGAFNRDGEGETWNIDYKTVNLSTIKQWLVK